MFAKLNDFVAKFEFQTKKLNREKCYSKWE